MTMTRKIIKSLRALSHPLSRAALWRGVAATYEHQALLNSLGPISTVIDVGANKGQFSLLCRLTMSNVAIHAFEPLSRPAAKFHDIFHKDAHVTLHRCALGQTASNMEMHIAGRDDSSSLMPQAAQADYFPKTALIGTEVVRIARLSDELTAQEIKKPCLMKIDVQGFEGEVLLGSSDLLPLIEWIYCEMSFVELYKGQPLANKVISWLAERGFMIAGVEVEPGMVFNGRSIQADFLFHKVTPQ